MGWHQFHFLNNGWVFFNLVISTIMQYKDMNGYETDFKVFIYIWMMGFLNKIEVWMEATIIMVMKPKQ
jgi:hypothetical protein